VEVRKAAIAAAAAHAHKIRKTNSIDSLWENKRGWIGGGFFDALNRTFMGGNVARTAYTQVVRFMPKKQMTAKETVVVAPPARAAKPKTPRVKAAKHSKAVSSEPVVTHTEAAHTEAAHAEALQANPENSREVIEQIAYGYWESRGYQHGRALEDWVRAEHEYRQRSAATLL
jgi:hypothetical protein